MTRDPDEEKIDYDILVFEESEWDVTVIARTA